MDSWRFDGLARALAAPTSRRAVASAVIATLIGVKARQAPGVSGARKRGERRRGRVLDVDSARCGNRCRSCSPLELRGGADLRGCDLHGQILTKSDLSSSNLRGACLQGANLRGATLDGSDLGGACLQDTILMETSLRGADLKQASLCGANLSGADLSGARVSAAQLACALICQTRLPDGARNDRDLGTNAACGACDIACNKDETCCGSSCAKLATDTRNCARCGNTCPPPTANVFVTCGVAPDQNGKLVHDCVYFCEEGWEDCDNDFDTGCDVFTRGDVNNCGGCGARCEAGWECCNCLCVPPGSNQCGECPTVTNARLIRRR